MIDAVWIVTCAIRALNAAYRFGVLVYAVLLQPVHEAAERGGMNVACNCPAVVYEELSYDEMCIRDRAGRAAASERPP